METSFLTFSPKILAKKNLSSSPTLRSSKPRLIKSKIRPLKDLYSSPSNFHNIERNKRRSFCSKKVDSDAVVLEDSVVVLSDTNLSIENNASGCTSKFSHSEKRYSQKSHSSPKCSGSNKFQDSSPPNDKFDEIRQWLDELHNAHEERSRVPAWSSWSPSSCTPKNNSNSNNCSLKSEEKHPSNWRIPKSSSDESERIVRQSIACIVSSDSESSGDVSVQSVSSGAVNRVADFSSSDNSSKTSNDVFSNRKGVDNDKFSRTSITSADSVISGKSTDRIISELYGKSWNKNSVLTPKTVYKSTPEEDVSSVEELLTELYSNTWNKEKVLTPVVNKTKIREVNGKENTPPATQNKVKVVISNSERYVNRGNNPKSTPANSRRGIKTTKSQETLSFLRSLSVSPLASQCNYQALLYKNEFKKNKETLCFDLFKLFNTEVFENKLPSTLKIDWNIRMNRTAGFCYNTWVLRSGDKVRSSRIELSTKVCSSADRVRDTLIHELCHAASWIVDGVKNGHGHAWIAWTKKAMKKFPELPQIRRCHAYSIETKYTYKCKRCGYSIGRHSKSLDLQRKRCGHCYGEFELFVNAKTRKAEQGSAPTPRTPRAASGFALYVKENYKAIKEKNSGLKHAEIMKLLGNQFSGMKVGSAQ